ncbi:hypothetical protein KCP71_19970 [Salmonella enterica subsp. enterica]|nr:hypothetical protein KCP71_19970 [Salmonella enterica subsp. enterica]
MLLTGRRRRKTAAKLLLNNSTRLAKPRADSYTVARDYCAATPAVTNRIIVTSRSARLRYFCHLYSRSSRQLYSDRKRRAGDQIHIRRTPRPCTAYDNAEAI